MSIFEKKYPPIKTQDFLKKFWVQVSLNLLSLHQENDTIQQFKPFFKVFNLPEYAVFKEKYDNIKMMVPEIEE